MIGWLGMLSGCVYYRILDQHCCVQPLGSYEVMSCVHENVLYLPILLFMPPTAPAKHLDLCLRVPINLGNMSHRILAFEILHVSDNFGSI